MQKQCRRRRADDSPLFMLLFPERLSANYHVVHLPAALLEFLFFADLNDFLILHVCFGIISRRFFGESCRGQIIFGDLLLKN